MSTFFYAAGAADSNGYVEGPPQKRYRQDAGWQIGRTFKGPTTAEAAFLTTVSPTVQDVDISYEGPVSVVSVWYASETSAGDSDPGTITAKDPIRTAWSLSGNTHNLPLLTHPDYSAVNPTVSNPYSLGQVAVAEILYILKVYLAAVNASEEQGTVPDVNTYADANILSIAAQDPYFAGVGSDTSEYRLARRRWLFKELVLENDEWEFAQPVLRKVELLRSISSTKASFLNTGRAFTWSALKNAEPTLDNALIIGIDTLDTMNGAGTWVWQKRFPSVEIASDGNRTLMQEYWGWQAFDIVRYGPIIE